MNLFVVVVVDEEKVESSLFWSKNGRFVGHINMKRQIAFLEMTTILRVAVIK